MNYKRLSKYIFPLMMVIMIGDGFANPTRLEVKSPLISYSSSQGIKLFNQTPKKYRQDFWQLSQYFTTEKGLAYCAPASIVMVLNALNIVPEIAPEHYPYKIFNQTNIFYNKKILAEGLSPARTGYEGITLDQASFILKQYTNHVSKYYGSEIKNIAAFKQILKSALQAKDTYIIVNFNRKDAGEKGGGHFSPIAAYSEKSDRFLVMDVARYKYPPVWIKSADLLKAIQRIDSSSNKSRGVIIISNQKELVTLPTSL